MQQTSSSTLNSGSLRLVFFCDDDNNDDNDDNDGDDDDKDDDNDNADNVTGRTCNVAAIKRRNTLFD